MDRGFEAEARQRRARVLDAFWIRFQGGQGAVPSYALAQAFEPQRGRAPGIEDVQVPDVAEEVQFLVAKPDQIFLELSTLFRR